MCDNLPSIRHSQSPPLDAQPTDIRLLRLLACSCFRLPQACCLGACRDPRGVAGRPCYIAHATLSLRRDSSKECNAKRFSTILFGIFAPRAGTYARAHTYTYTVCLCLCACACACVYSCRHATAPPASSGPTSRWRARVHPTVPAAPHVDYVALQCLGRHTHLPPHSVTTEIVDLKYHAIANRHHASFPPSSLRL